MILSGRNLSVINEKGINILKAIFEIREKWTDFELVLTDWSTPWQYLSVLDLEWCKLSWSSQILCWSLFWKLSLIGSSKKVGLFKFIAELKSNFFHCDMTDWPPPPLPTTHIWQFSGRILYSGGDWNSHVQIPWTNTQEQISWNRNQPNSFSFNAEYPKLFSLKTKLSKFVNFMDEILSSFLQMALPIHWSHGDCNHPGCYTWFCRSLFCFGKKGTRNLQMKLAIFFKNSTFYRPQTGVCLSIGGRGGWADPPQSDTMGYGQLADGTHPTGMHSCWCY